MKVEYIEGEDEAREKSYQGVKPGSKYYLTQFTNSNYTIYPTLLYNRNTYNPSPSLTCHTNQHQSLYN